MPPLPRSTADVVTAFQDFVAQLGEESARVQDLQDRVSAHGGGTVPALLPDNETPLRPLRSMFTDDVVARIQKFYAVDFETWFADADPVPGGALDDSDYPPTQLLEVARLVDRHARIGQLSDLAERLQQEIKELRNRLRRARKSAGA